MISRAGGGGAGRVAAGASVRTGADDEPAGAGETSAGALDAASGADGAAGGGPGGCAWERVATDATVTQIAAAMWPIHALLDPVLDAQRAGCRNIYGNSRMRRSRNSAHIGLPAWSWRARIPERSASEGSSSVKSSVSRPFMK